MNRRNFLSALGIGAATAAVAPKAIAEAAPPKPKFSDKVNIRTSVNDFAATTGLAQGSVINPPKLWVTGEQGPELVVYPAGARIVDAATAERRLSEGHATGGVVKPPLYAVGERGPEFVVIRPGSRIVLSSPTRRPTIAKADL